MIHMGRGHFQSPNQLVFDFTAPRRRPSMPPRVVRISAPVSLAQRECSDCGATITIYSRGRCKRCGDTARMRPVPVDFLDRLEVLGSAGCADHYKASLTTITKWRKLKGLKSQFRARKTAHKKGLFRGFAQKPVFQHRDHSKPGQAADFLRRFGAVFRCNERRLADPKGKFWNRNGHLLSDDDIMARAGRLGWVAIRI